MSILCQDLRQIASLSCIKTDLTRLKNVLLLCEIMQLFNRKNRLTDEVIEHRKELRKERNRRYYLKRKANIEVQEIRSTLQKLQRLQEMPIKPVWEGF